MKFLKVILLGMLIPVIVLGQSDGAVSWYSGPKPVPNGWYWAYDDTESAPPFADPVISPIDEIEFEAITSTGTKIDPSDDIPFAYVMPDSFWYFGVWYVPGDTLYISPDGWLSFDPEAAAGFPDSPIGEPFPKSADPNTMITCIWQDHDPTRTPGNVTNNRVYYLHDSILKSFIVEWYQVEAASSGNTYTFEVMLDLGGQNKLTEYGDCGVMFSYHFIHFLFDQSAEDWEADGGVTGVEDQHGEYGITYKGSLTDGRVIRIGYKKIFTHDVGPEEFLTPQDTVLRWTQINPLVRVGNFGKETESFSVTIDIYDEDEVQVYHDQGYGIQLLPGDAKSFKGGTWTPGEIAQEYRLVAYTDLGRDQCTGNDTLIDICVVGCINESSHPDYQEMHDITCSDIQVSNTGFVKSGTPVQPYLEVANVGWHLEPASSGSWAILGILGGSDTVYMDSTPILNNIGWLGDPTDNPDTVSLILPPWTPEGKCSEDGLYYYDMVGMVRLGKIEPDASDHCPTNDTLWREIACLFPHDVGVTEATWPELPDEPPDVYYPGSTITIIAAVENFGYNDEHDVRVRCEIKDMDSGGIILWHALQAIEFLDWRGNAPGLPYTTQVAFPTYTLNTNHYQSITCFTEMLGDGCPHNDEVVRFICGGVEEHETPPGNFILEIPGSRGSGKYEIRFAVPYQTRVKLDVFDVNGRLVTSIADDIYEAGYYERPWDGCDGQNRKVAAGIYLVRMRAGGFSSVRKIVLLK